MFHMTIEIAHQMYKLQKSNIAHCYGIFMVQLYTLRA